MIIGLIIGAVIVGIARILFRHIHDRVPPSPTIARLHPPGPKGLPWLGNIFQIPYDSAWEVYREWGKQFGEIRVFTFWLYMAYGSTNT